MKYILASKSPRRRELLKNIGMDFEVMASNFDESTVPKDIEPQLYVQELALCKAMSLVKQCDKDSLIIGADTVVCADGEIIGKPCGRREAISMLSSLSGKAHKVYTGVALVSAENAGSMTSCEETTVYFDEIPLEEIEYYVNTYAPFDKAGAYGIQEYAGVFIKKIEGDYFNIVGLPVHLLHKLIRKFGEE